MKKIIVSDTTLRINHMGAEAPLSFKEKIEIARQLENLKVDIIEAYRTYKDNVISNPFQDEYYYIDYNYKLIKVNSTKEVF